MLEVTTSQGFCSLNTNSHLEKGALWSRSTPTAGPRALGLCAKYSPWFLLPHMSESGCSRETSKCVHSCTVKKINKQKESLQSHHPESQGVYNENVHGKRTPSTKRKSFFKCRFYYHIQRLHKYLDSSTHNYHNSYFMLMYLVFNLAKTKSTWTSEIPFLR